MHNFKVILIFWWKLEKLKFIENIFHFISGEEWVRYEGGWELKKTLSGSLKTRKLIYDVLDIEKVSKNQNYNIALSKVNKEIDEIPTWYLLSTWVRITLELALNKWLGFGVSIWGYYKFSQGILY